MQKRLDSREVAELVAAYEAGDEAKKLSSRFGIHRAMVHEILKRQGVVRRTAIQPEDLPEVIRLYEAGWSLARVGAGFDVSARTVGDALRKAGVPIRPRGRIPASA